MISESEKRILSFLKGYALNYSEDPCYLSGKNPDSAVAAVFVSGDNIVYGTNKRYVTDDIVVDSSNKQYYIEHAERVVLHECVRLNIMTYGGTLYVTKYPCADCARAIKTHGIARVVCAESYRDGSKWCESQKAAEIIFKNSGIIVEVDK